MSGDPENREPRTTIERKIHTYIYICICDLEFAEQVIRQQHSSVLDSDPGLKNMLDGWKQSQEMGITERCNICRDTAAYRTRVLLGTGDPG